MYFFRIKISSFDDEEKTLFVIPEQNTDEQGVPFDEKLLTQTAEYKQFVKETATNMVDGEYTQFRTDAVFDTLNEQEFAQLEAEGKLTTVDGNTFAISTGFKPKKSGGGKLDFKTIAIIAGIAVVGLALLIFSFAGGGSSDESSSETSEVSETVESDTSETSTSEPETSETSSEESSLPAESSSESSGYVDEPPESTVSEPTDTTETADSGGYTNSGYSGGSSSGASGVYTISFNPNGGEGAIEGISAEAGQYVVLPSAETAAKSISKKGYKLIGFSDNTEISYPLYHYKMPYQNVTMFAVWEPDTFSVTYNSNGGTGQVSRAEVKYGDDVPLPSDIPVYKDGLYLAGWAQTANAKTALKSLKMPSENITLYAVWSSKAPTAKITLHYDDKVQVIEKEIGSTVDMLDSFGVFKDGYSVEGWYLENSPVRIEKLHITEDCHVYAKWQIAKYITVTIDQSYLNKTPQTFTIPLDMTGKAVLKLPKVDDKGDIYNHVEGCTYGFSDKKQSGEFGTIKYYGETECEFTKDTTLYRVLNEYGGGAGTKENPYIISYYDQLIRLSEQKASGYFKQTADIKFPSDAERKPIDTKKISRGYEDKSYDFFVYDGQGFAIKGLSGEGGLFGTIAGSTIENVVIDGANIKAGEFENVGILCNEVTSYAFKSQNGEDSYSMGNSVIRYCTVKNGKIESEKAANVGGLVGYGGNISYCRAEQINVNGGDSVGGIVGNACIVKGSLANGITTSGTIKSAGGIAGTAYGAEIFDNGDKSYMSGGSIIGCGVRTFSTKAENSGGIVGTATADTTSAYIKSCYVANVYLNGRNNGGIAGADGEYGGHRIAYCLVDNANGYAVIGAKKRSVSKTVVLSVPADSGLTVDGVLSVLNAAGSGFDNWERSENTNGGYPYPSKITF
ncbi:MAG: InlB B-repeat-containing protein [Ruminococcus sp.]|nr:InlB B-repeat-containing protein [Ruminococcus sp.]